MEILSLLYKLYTLLDTKSASVFLYLYWWSRSVENYPISIKFT